MAGPFRGWEAAYREGLAVVLETRRGEHPMEQSREWTCGMHRLWHEPPDMLWGTFVGTVTPEDVRCMMTLYEEVTRQGPVYVISDVAHSDLPPESRKYIAEHGHPEWMCGLVYIGADVRQQAISKALSVAILFSSTARFETVFVDTLDQAREWVEANRARRAQQRVG